MTTDEAITGLADYYGKKLSGWELDVYAAGLKDLSPERLEAVCVTAFRLSKFMPKLAELLEYAGDTGKAVESRASQAWTEVREAIGRVGSYRAPVFQDRLAAEAVQRIGGWGNLCQRDAEWLNDWGRKSFMSEYESIVKFGGQENRQLEGRHGTSNVKALPAVAGIDMPAEARQALARLGL